MSLPSPSIASSDATLVPSSSAFGQAAVGESTNVQIYVPEYNIQKCTHANLDDSIWEIKQQILTLLPKDMQEGFNYGLFLPPCNGRAGKFLLEERPLRDYPFQDCVPYLELKYKKRVYKMLNLDEKMLKQLHTKTTLKKFLDYVEERQQEKVEKVCAQGLDPNYHDSTGETPLTIASSVDDNRDMILALTSGGAHLDYRNLEGQTALHKAAFLSTHSNIKTLLELGASPNYRDPLGLTPLYYCMLKTTTNPNTAELLLRDYAEIGVTDPHGNQEAHQACKNGLVPHLEHLLFYGAEINCQNVNGNTPLHVCAVNNQEACARVLLFRGADSNIVNNQGQTAFHVAVITGHHGVAELIRTHDANTAVPYRGIPRYNSKRRLARRSPASDSISIGRAKSLNGSSGSSECNYGTMRGPRNAGMRSLSHVNGGITTTPSPSVAPSPSIMRHSISCNNPPQPDHVQQQYGVPMAGHVQNRILHQPNFSMQSISGNQTMPPECRPAVLQMIKKSVSEQNALAAAGHFATMRGMPDSSAMAPIQRIPAEMANQLGAPGVMNADVNIPRILVIPRGSKGFGFILRGAKKVDATVNFEPTPEIPALQYFEGVDMNGMAMKAGLKPGDFLLEINGNDVRCASHDQVVHLIQMSGETISLKVITIDPTEPLPPVPYYGTLRRNSKAAPPPPLRHPATSLSIAAGRSLAGLVRCDEYAVGGSIPYHGHHHARSVIYPNATMIAKSIDHIPIAYRDAKDKVASVRGRVNSRRISAAELEQLMSRQNGNGINHLSFSSESETPGTPSSFRASSGGTPKVYNSVAEMKRQKLQRMQQQQAREILLVDSGSSSTEGNGVGGLKSFHSSPDLQANELALARDRRHMDHAYDGQSTIVRRHDGGILVEADRFYATNCRQAPPERHYGVPPKCQRPKTPPPAPPVNAMGDSRGRPGLQPQASINSNDSIPYQRGQPAYQCSKQQQPHIPEPDYDDPPVGERSRSHSTAPGIPPAPPPPPPPPVQPVANDLKTALAMKRQQIMNKPTSGASNDPGAAECDSTKSQGHAEEGAGAGKADFNSDLKNAIARRRTQLDKQHSGDQPASGDKPASHSSADAKSGRIVGMSLKESVQKNIQTNGAGRKTCSVAGVGTMAPAKNEKPNVGGNNSPPIPNGFAQKKDSGFSSSRNSLEPSEYEETATTSGNGNGHHQETTIVNNEDSLKQYRVSFLSHQLEDSMGTTQIRGRTGVQSTKPGTQGKQSADQQDAISLTSTLSTLSGCSDATGSSGRPMNSIPPMPDGPPPVPPPDYDAADSGTGDSENDDVTPTLSQQNLAHQSAAFRNKSLISWSMGDVCDWLDSLYLSEYKRGFSRSNVDGRRLLSCDRTQFTKLGVTRIAHRIAMENSLKQFKSDGSQK